MHPLYISKEYYEQYYQMSFKGILYFGATLDIAFNYQGEPILVARYEYISDSGKNPRAVALWVGVSLIL